MDKKTIIIIVVVVVILGIAGFLYFKKHKKKRVNNPGEDSLQDVGKSASVNPHADKQ